MLQYRSQVYLENFLKHERGDFGSVVVPILARWAFLEPLLQSGRAAEINKLDSWCNTPKRVTCQSNISGLKLNCFTLKFKKPNAFVTLWLLSEQIKLNLLFFHLPQTGSHEVCYWFVSVHQKIWPRNQPLSPSKVEHLTSLFSFYDQQQCFLNRREIFFWKLVNARSISSQCKTNVCHCVHAKGESLHAAAGSDEFICVNEWLTIHVSYITWVICSPGPVFLFFFSKIKQKGKCGALDIQKIVKCSLK